MTVSAPEPSFWRGKRVLLTGHTGFKGAWLALWLRRLPIQPRPASSRPDSQETAR